MIRPRLFFLLICLSFLAVVFLFGGVAAAAEGSSDWRPTYDLVMKWVNFFILLSVIVKYTRRPLKNFLADRKADLEQEVQHLEQEKERITERVNLAMKTLEESAETLATLRARILREGEKERDRLIQEARSQAQMMLEGSKRKIENKLRRAKRSVITEIVDSAVALALQRLPGTITPEDHQRWIDRFTALELTQ